MTIQQQSGASEVANQRAAAFTLLELLIATSIFATVFLAINAVFYGAMHLHTTTTRFVEESVPVNRVGAFLKRDFENILSPAPTGGLSGEFISGIISNVMSDPFGSLEFYTSSGVISDDYPWGDIQRVGYTLMTPTNLVDHPGRDLVRLVTRNLLPPVAQDLPEEQRLLGGVEKLEFYFHDGTDWVDYWDSTTADMVMPKAIKVRLELAADQNDRRPKPPIQFVFPIDVQKLTNSASATTSTTGGM